MKDTAGIVFLTLAPACPRPPDWISFVSRSTSAAARLPNMPRMAQSSKILIVLAGAAPRSHSSATVVSVWMAVPRTAWKAVLSYDSGASSTRGNIKAGRYTA